MKVTSKLYKLGGQIGKENIDQWVLCVQLEKLKKIYEEQNNAKYINAVDRILGKLRNQNMQTLRADYITQNNCEDALRLIDELMSAEDKLYLTQSKCKNEKDSLRIAQIKLSAYGATLHEDLCKLGIGTKENPRELKTWEKAPVHNMLSRIEKRLGESINWQNH